MIPTNKNVIWLDDEWWYVGCKDGGKRRLDSHIKKNETRMFVSGKYIPKIHPLHKPGRYKTFQDAAFSALSKYKDVLEGEIYVISNPAWDGWLKVGMAIDAEDRLKNYQTGSPFRDYKIEYKVHFNDRRWAENKIHETLDDFKVPRKGEWFDISFPKLKAYIRTIERMLNGTKAA